MKEIKKKTNEIAPFNTTECKGMVLSKDEDKPGPGAYIDTNDPQYSSVKHKFHKY